jgi:hypothetical protein
VVGSQRRRRGHRRPQIGAAVGEHVHRSCRTVATRVAGGSARSARRVDGSSDTAVAGRTPADLIEQIHPSCRALSGRALITYRSPPGATASVTGPMVSLPRHPMPAGPSCDVFWTRAEHHA